MQLDLSASTKLARKEIQMKLMRYALAILVLAGLAYPQTVDHGMGAFSNESGAILMAVDAALVNRAVKEPYVMFYGFLASKDPNVAVRVAAKDVVMVYKGQDYPMLSLSELRDKYRGEIRDMSFYRKLGKEGIISSWVRLYDFPEPSSFFPPLTLNSPLAVSEAYMLGLNGFMTPLYFKNPGFAKGDRLTIKVRDAKNPALTGECDVVLD
jgi:hypothetical protein